MPSLYSVCMVDKFQYFGLEFSFIILLPNKETEAGKSYSAHMGYQFTWDTFSLALSTLHMANRN